jgi:hypothetical protein
MSRGNNTQVAAAVPFDNDTNGFDSTDVQGAIEEINESIIEETSASASPGFGFGRAGNVVASTWLTRSGGVPSNKTGVVMGINTPTLQRISIGNEDVNTFDISIYEHDGNEINLTLLTTVSVVSERTDSFTESDFGTVAATSGKQLAVRVTSGSAKNLGVDITIKGTNP